MNYSDTTVANHNAFAANLAEAIGEYYPLKFFPWRHIALAANTSNTPLIRVDLGNGEIYNVTITRARK